MSQSGVYKWSTIDRIGNSVITFGGNIVLARLLDPSDFGLLAMVAIFTALAGNISSCGMADGLIHDREVTDRDYSTVFVYNGAMGLFFAIAFIILSGPIASFFGHPQLEDIMWAIGICFFFQMLCLTQETKLRKELEMKKMAFVHLAATATSVGVGIALALNGLSYWGLVSTRVFLSFFQFVYFIIVTKWIPRIAFYTDSFKNYFSYGVHLMIAYMCTQFSRNINASVLGKFQADPSSAGLYSQAQKLEEVPFMLSESILNWPFFAVVSKEGNSQSRRKLIEDMHSMILFINIGLMCMLIAVAAPGFHLLYGPKWDAAVPIFRILVLYGGLTSIKYFYQTVLKVHSKTKLIRNLTLIEVVLQLGLLLLVYFVFHCNFLLIALTQVVAVIAVGIVYVWQYRRLVGLSFVQLLSTFKVPVFMMVVAYGVTSVFTFWWLGLVSSIVGTLSVVLLFGLIVAVLGRWFGFEPYMRLRSRVVSFFKDKML